MAASRRALHWVFKVGQRADTMRFYREVLGMKVLRHEEFEKGCEAACNGPYDGKWSKTMVGYGPEDNHFVVELTYNYNISSYKLGNDFQGITIQSSECLARAETAGWPLERGEGGLAKVLAPGGYPFFIIDLPQPSDRDPVVSVGFSCSSLSSSLTYWGSLLGMSVTAASQTQAVLSYPGSASILLHSLGGAPVDHAKAAGRIAFSCPAQQLQGIEEAAKAGGHSILTPLISLDTPGKATVQVVILGDPDGQEICFVGDEAFRELSAVDPQGDSLLEEALKADKSDEWFKRKGRSKVTEA